jgi:hypothetical protein
MATRLTQPHQSLSSFGIKPVGGNLHVVAQRFPTAAQGQEGTQRSGGAGRPAVGHPGHRCAAAVQRATKTICSAAQQRGVVRRQWGEVHWVQAAATGCMY